MRGYARDVTPTDPKVLGLVAAQKWLARTTRRPGSVGFIADTWADSLHLATKYARICSPRRGQEHMVARTDPRIPDRWVKHRLYGIKTVLQLCR